MYCHYLTYCIHFLFFEVNMTCTIRRKGSSGMYFNKCIKGNEYLICDLQNHSQQLPFDQSKEHNKLCFKILLYLNSNIIIYFNKYVDKNVATSFNSIW